MRLSLEVGIRKIQRLLISGLVLGIAALSACGSSAGAGASSVQSLSRPTHHDWQIKVSAAPTPILQAAASASSLRASYIKTVQSEAGADYAARAVRFADAPNTEGFHFDSPAQSLSAELRHDGVRVEVARQDGRGAATFRLSHYGCADDIGARLPPAQPTAGSTRVSYSRPDLIEWYQNGKLGIEQGFDLQRAPSCGDGQNCEAVALQIEVAHSLHATLMHGGDGSEWLELRDDAGQTVLRYSDLFAEDAEKRPLPARLAFAADVLTLRIDATDARYPLRIDPLIWSQLGSVYKAGDADAGDQLGSAIAVSGDTAIVGAPFDDEGGTDAGAAYLFQLNSQGAWLQQAKIIGANPAANFGQAVGITDLGEKKRVVIGAPNFSAGDGLASWFSGHGSNWTPEAEFTGSGQLGGAVAVSGNHILIGAPSTLSGDGVAIIYEPDVTLTPPWSEAAIIQDPPGSAGNLGGGAAIDGDVAVIGAPLFDTAGPDDGRAYLYERSSGGTWIQTATLTASDAAAGDHFGLAIAISDVTLAIGAPAKGTQGAAYIFTSVFGTFGQQARLHALTGVTLANGDRFGGSVAIDGEAVAVGASGTTASGLANAGAAYLFERSSGVWSLTKLLNPKTPAAQEGFGSGVTIQEGGGHILVGAAQNDIGSADSGAFYDFTERKQNGDPCAAAVECASDFCVDGVCCNSACGGGSASDCQACSTASGAQSNGVCGATQASAAFVCRPAAGICDQDEVCDGISLACPPDLFQPTLAVCRPAGGACDLAERCTGSSPNCPPDDLRPAQTVCRPSVGSCDLAERCDGQTKTCPVDSLSPRYTICRLPASDCDQFEYCTGDSADCPADGPAADGTACGGGRCQAGVCRSQPDGGTSIDAGSSSTQPKSGSSGCSASRSQTGQPGTLGAASIALALALFSARRRRRSR